MDDHHHHHHHWLGNASSSSVSNTLMADDGVEFLVDVDDLQHNWSTTTELVLMTTSGDSTATTHQFYRVCLSSHFHHVDTFMALFKGELRDHPLEMFTSKMFGIISAYLCWPHRYEILHFHLARSVL